MAEYLGELAEAERCLQRYDRKVKFARERLKRAVKDDSFLIVRVSRQNLYVYCNRSINEVFFHDLRLAPAYRFDGSVCDQPVTIEQLADFDADRLLLLVRQEAETLAYWKTLQYSMPWQELKAVRNRRVYSISPDPWCEYSACAHDRIIDEALKLFSGNRPNCVSDIVHGRTREDYL